MKLLLNVLRPKKPEGDTYFAHYVWGFSSQSSDVDNPTKPTQDVLFDYWGMKSKDQRVKFMILEAVSVEKGDEFIGFHVDDKENLVEYLENLVKTLKKED